jgi:hypothetical protein
MASLRAAALDTAFVPMFLQAFEAGSLKKLVGMTRLPRGQLLP